MVWPFGRQKREDEFEMSMSSQLPEPGHVGSEGLALVTLSSFPSCVPASFYPDSSCRSLDAADPATCICVLYSSQGGSMPCEILTASPTSPFYR